MRLKIECILEENFVCLDYRRSILSFIKKSLENYSEEIKKKYYDEYKAKDMTFACYFPIEKIENNQINLTNNIFAIFLSFDSIIDGVHFYNAFNIAKRNHIQFNLGKNIFQIKNIVKLQEKEIKEDKATFKTLSPIVIREQIEEGEKKKEWFYELDEKGIEILKRNLCYSLKDKFSIKELEKIEIEVEKSKTSIISFYKIKFPATNGRITIKGDKKILNYFYRAGIGSKCPSGFGLLDLD